MQTQLITTDTAQHGTAPEPEASANPQRLSDLLQNITDAPSTLNERIFLGGLIDTFGNRAFGALIFIFALPVAVPIAIPGISAILGAPLLLLTWQLMRGRTQPWLPDVMRNRSFRRVDFDAIMKRVLPWVRRLERLLGPRMIWLARNRAENLIGGLAFVMAMILFLPVPFGNTVPALAIAILALALLERDGIAVIVGTLVGCAAVAIVSGVAFGFVKGTIFLVRSLILV